MNSPSEIFILHITHISNLQSIIADGCLWSDRKQLEKRHCRQTIGLSHVKERRLKELKVSCNPGTMVGDYVPFYFHPHSPMLYYIHKQGSELNYSGGQADVLYLVARMSNAINWAEEHGRWWAFTNGNAGAYICDFFNDIKDLDKINWNAVKQRYWSDCKDAKQSEFLVYEYFPWDIFEYIGVYGEKHKEQVENIITNSIHKPTVKIQRNWYY